MYFLFKMGIFHCYVCLPEGTFLCHAHLVKACLHLLSSVRLGLPQAPMPSVRPVVVQLNCAPRALSARRSLSLVGPGICRRQEPIKLVAERETYVYVCCIYSQDVFQWKMQLWFGTGNSDNDHEVATVFGTLMQFRNSEKWDGIFGCVCTAEAAESKTCRWALCFGCQRENSKCSASMLFQKIVASCKTP